MRLISVVMGEESSDIRNQDSIKMLNYGFNGYKLNNLLNTKKSLGTIKIKKSKKEKTNVYLENDINIISKNGTTLDNYSYDIKLNNATAPLKSNSIVGTLIVKDSNNKEVTRENIIIKEPVYKSNLLNYFSQNIKVFLSGKI